MDIFTPHEHTFIKAIPGRAFVAVGVPVGEDKLTFRKAAVDDEPDLG